MLALRAAFFSFLAVAYWTATVSAFNINFQNKCPYTVWAAVGKAPNGFPDGSISFGQRLNPGEQADYGVADTQIGIRAWGRTGCDGSGANCQTGACNGGLKCTDAGITSHALLSEYGAGADGREYWNLSYVGGSINIPTRLTCTDGQKVFCANGKCPSNQAFKNDNDFSAVRSSNRGSSFSHIFCG